MQIHELTRKKQLNEVDLAGQGGLWSGIKSAAKAMVQPGGVKDALRTVAPGANQGLGSTAALATSDFAQRMQAVKNNAAIKQVAANLQKQWNQVSKTLPTTQAQAPAAEPESGPETTTPSAPPATAPASPSTRSRLASKAAAYKATRTEGVQLDEAASLGQLTDWYKQSVIPKSMAAASAKYLANPVIKTALNKIIATADNPGEQSKAFADLVSATSVVSQEISAAAPAAATTSGAPAGPRTLASSADAAKTNISRAAGIPMAQIEALAKITSKLGRVNSTDPTTIAYLQALGFNTQ
jgi:hypothetical protein